MGKVWRHLASKSVNQKTRKLIGVWTVEAVLMMNPERNKDSPANRPRSHLCLILVNNLFLFPKAFSELEF